MKWKELADEIVLLIVLLVLSQADVKALHFIFLVEVVIDEDIESKNEIIDSVFIV